MKNRGMFDELKREFDASRAREAVKAFTRNEFDARFFPTSQDAVNEVLSLIPTGSRVGAGGSVTLQEIGILEALAQRGDEVVYHRPEMSPEENFNVRKSAILCPYFLCSANALTIRGELVNIDGIGNRVCGMIFGPHTVFILAGVNKIVTDLNEAISRVRNVAAPANARRLGINVPCVEKGICVNCKTPSNICRITVIMSRRPILTDVKVFIIGEALGL